MLLKHRTVLIAKRDVIVKDLRVTDVFSILRGKFVLTKNDQEEILHETTSKGQAEKLLDILPLKGDDVDAFKWFLNSLEEKYEHLVCLLKECESSSQHVDINSEASNQNEGEESLIVAINLIYCSLLSRYCCLFHFYPNSGL